MDHLDMYSQNALETADAVVSYVQSYMRRLGTISVRDGALFIGNLPLDGDTSIVDMVKERFGFGCTIFLGNLRISTTATALDSDERALGTTANAKITQQVYRRGVRFKGVTRTLEKEWVIVYDPLRDDTGRIIGMIACYRELSDYLFDLGSLDGTTEAIMVLETTGHLRDTNSTTCDMLGSSRGDLMQSNLFAFTEGMTHRDLLRVHNEALSHPTIFEAFWRRRDGFQFPVTISVCAFLDGDREPGLLAIIRDFSEEYEARTRLRDLNRKLAQVNSALEGKVAARTAVLLDTLTQRDAMLKHLSDGLLTVDADGVIEVSNPAMTALMGWDAIQPVGMPLSILNPSFAELVNECLATKRGITDTMLLPNDGIGEATVSAILVEDDSRHDNTRCMGCVLLLRDVTEAQEMARIEQETRRLALANKELALDVAVSELQSTRQNHFMAHMSHELRTPLNAILGYSDMLMEELPDVDPMLVSDVQKIHKAGTQLLGLINGLLDLTKIEMGKVEVEFVDVSMSTLMSELETMIEPMLLEKRNTFQYTYSPDVTALRTDMTKLRQILLHLLTNACGSTEDGDIVLHVDMTHNGWVRFEVRDTGVGMSQEQADVLFEPFVERGRRTKIDSTGLGLALSKRFCGLLGGDISVESTPGEGTTFQLQIPLHPTEHAATLPG